MSTAIATTAELAQRLAEAEATIEALLAGQIDAVVDSTSRTPFLLAKAQEALRDSEERYRRERDRAQQYLDTAEVMLLGLDAGGTVDMVNRYACLVLGWSSEELIGRDFIETCVPARLRKETRVKLGQVHAGPDSSVVNNRVVTRSGEERMIEWRNRLQRDDAGRVISTLSSGVDVTERNQTSESLRIADERTHFMLQAAGVGLWEMDYTSGRLVWSETLEAHYGLQPGTFDGTFDAFVELIHPDDRASVMSTIADAMERGSDFHLQNRSVWPDGTVRWLTGGGRVHTDASGEPSRAVGISLDVTELHKLELQYQQAQKMEAVGRLAGGVAHDFNNLLMVITGYSDLLLQGMMVGDSRRADLEQIRRAADGAAALTKQLLAFSRQQVIQPTMIGLEDVVRSATQMLKRLIGEDVELLTHLNTTTSSVYIDAGQLEQVIMNLAVNARDAMPTGGTITIDTSVVSLSEKDATAQGHQSAGRFAVLSVSDTGTGMDEQTRSRIFEPFFTTKEPGKGTGLGLATAYGIVRQANGSIEVISAPDRGTVFRIYLPFFEDPIGVKDDSPATPVTPRGVETILLVEDSTGVRDIALRVLEGLGYTVLASTSASQALELARTFAGTIDLLLTDVIMPEFSGRVLAERFAEHHPKAKLLFMSGYTDDAVRRHGVKPSEIPYLQKPFSPHELGVRVRATLDAAT